MRTAIRARGGTVTGNEGNPTQGANGKNPTEGAEGDARESTEPAEARGDPGGQTGRGRRWLLVLFAVGALVSIALYLVWPVAEEEADFRTALFQALQLNEGDTLLFVNLPPAAGRYPGSILLFDGNIPLDFVSGDDAGLMVGQPVSLERQIRVSSAAELGLGVAGTQEWMTAAANALSRREGQVDVTVAFDGSTVESRDLVSRVAASALARNISEAGVDAYVIVRAWRGTVSLTIQSRRGTSAQVLDTLSATLDSIATSAGAGVRFSGSFESGQQGVLRLSEDDVFAYEGFELAPFYRLVAGIAPDDPVAGGEAGTRPAAPRPQAPSEVAVRQLLRLDPAVLSPEGRERALTELGPGAAAAVVSVMETGEREEQERGMALLRELPPSAFQLAPGSGPEADRTLDAALRARTMLDLSAVDPAERNLLGTALQDPSPAIRYLASEQLYAAGTADARATLMAQADSGDPAVLTALNAAQFQEIQARSPRRILTHDTSVARPSPVEVAAPAAVVQGPDIRMAVGSVRATRSATVDPQGKLDVFVRGLASEHPEVVRESLLGLAEMGAEGRPAMPAVERLLSTSEDRRIQDLARRTLARLRAAGG